MCCCNELKHCGVVFADFALTFVNRWLMHTSSCLLPHQWQLLSTGWQKNIINVCLSHKLESVSSHTCTYHHSGSCRDLGQAKQIEEVSRLKKHYSIYNNPNLTFICWGERGWFVAGDHPGVHQVDGPLHCSHWHIMEIHTHLRHVLAWKKHNFHIKMLKKVNIFTLH